MTDKEQIIIDGVDVSGCSVYKDGICIQARTKCNAVCDYASYYLREQLARKTQECDTLKSQLDFEVQQKECIKQECEELKEQNQELRNSLSDSLMFRFTSQDKEIDRYRKALEEIELTIKNLEKGDILTFPDFTLQENATMIINQCNQGYRDILDIINKAKDGNNE